MNFNFSPAIIKLIDKYKELDVFMKTATVLLILSPSVFIYSKAYRIIKEPKTVFVPKIEYKDTCISKPNIDTFGLKKPQVEKNEYKTTIESPTAPIHIGPDNR